MELCLRFPVGVVSIRFPRHCMSNREIRFDEYDPYSSRKANVLEQPSTGVTENKEPFFVVCFDTSRFGFCHSLVYVRL